MDPYQLTNELRIVKKTNPTVNILQQRVYYPYSNGYKWINVPVVKEEDIDD